MNKAGNFGSFLAIVSDELPPPREICNLGLRLRPGAPHSRPNASVTPTLQTAASAVIRRGVRTSIGVATP